MIQSAVAKTHTNAMNLAITAAQKMSDRGSIGWSIIDLDNNILTHNSVMAGFEYHRLNYAVAHYKESIYELLITIEPTIRLMDARHLIKSLDNSSCKKISIALKIEDHFIDNNWKKWISQWGGDITYYNGSDTTKNLSLGILKVIEHNRPWVTAFCTSNKNQESPSTQQKQLHFSSHMHKAISQSRSFMYELGKDNIVEKLPKFNNIEEPINIYEVSDTRTVKSILEHSASQGHCCTTLSCNSPLLEKLIKLNLVDEIMYNTTNKKEID